MRRSTTSVATDARHRAHARSRTTLTALLIAELICALLLLGRADAPAPTAAAPVALTAPTAASSVATLRDGRTMRLIGLGGARTGELLSRVAAEFDTAAAAVDAFWGADWPREVVVVAAGTDAQFAALGGGDSHTAATTTGERMVFAPGAADMSESALRIVLRHELFHYAARAKTAPDAPRWLTEGVADFVARPPASPPPTLPPDLPTDAELSGSDRSMAYDRAWWFSRFVAERYDPTRLRELYLRACGPGHPDVATAVAETLGEDLSDVLARWRQWASR